MNAGQKFYLGLVQVLSYVLPGWLFYAAWFNTMAFKKPHGREIIIYGGAALFVGNVVFHCLIWRGIFRRERERAEFRRGIERTFHKYGQG